MRVRVVMLIVALTASAAGEAQRKRRPPPAIDCGPFACPPRPIARKLPSEEALALGRRIVWVIDQGAVAKRNAQLVAMARAKMPRRPPVPTHPDGPIRAVPPVDLADWPEWGFVLQQRVIDHAALHYARKYSLDELQAMAAFFESSGGKKLVEERQAHSVELEHELSTEVLEDDLWNVACNRPVPQEVEDAPHHEFHRLHPPIDYPVPPPGAWCAAVPTG